MGDTGPGRGGDIKVLLRSLASDTDGPGALQPAYTAFIESMEAYRSGDALDLARAMHRRSLAMFEAGLTGTAVWSVFCLEGALRRGATEVDQGARYAEASAAIRHLQNHSSTSSADRLALVQRHAIVAAGFGRTTVERADLGAALAQGGIDGAQITGFARLMAASAGRGSNGPAGVTEGGTQTAPGHANGDRTEDWETAEALFASLVDRTQRDPADSKGPLSVGPDAAPWALRGHGLAALGRLRAAVPGQDTDSTPSHPRNR